MKKILCLLLSAVMLAALCACAPAGETPAEATFKGKTSAEYAGAGFPDNLCGEMKLVESYGEKSDASVHVEMEDYVSATMAAEIREDEKFVAGKLVYAVDTLGDDTYSVTYKVNIPSSMPYRFTMVASKGDDQNTTDFYVYVNGEKTFRNYEADNLGKASSGSLPMIARGCICKLDCGIYEFEAGETTFEFVLKDSDSDPNDTYHFYGDWFELTPVDYLLTSGDVFYDAEPTGEYAEQLTGAGKVHVFSDKIPVRLSIDARAFSSAASGDVTLSVTDVDGKTLFEEKQTVGVGKYTYTLGFGTLPVGYYNVHLTDKNGVERFTDTFCVIIDPSSRHLYDDTPYAMMMGTGEDEWFLHEGSDETATVFDFASVAKLIGVSTMRVGTNWKWYEEKYGEYNFNRSDRTHNLDAQAEQLRRAGIKVLRWINGQPYWAQGNTFTNCQLEIYRLCKTLADRYKDVVTTWEIWNEQDWFEAESPDLYSSFCKAALIGISDANAGVAGIVGALCQSPEDGGYALNPVTYKENGLFDLTGAFNYHYHVFDYAGKFITPFIQDTTAGDFVEYIKKNCPDLPVWVTEAGILLGRNADTDALTLGAERVQARYLVTSMMQSVTAGTDRHFWFILTSGYEDAGDFGAFTIDTRPRPAIVAESVMTDALGKGIYLGTLNGIPEKAEGYLFDNGEDDVAVIYSTSTEELVLHTGANVLMTTIYGQKSVLAADKNGDVTVPISPNAVYLTFDGKAPASIFTPTDVEPVKEVEPLTGLTKAQHVVLTQVFSGTDMAVAKSSGYAVSADGTKMTLKVLNLNDCEVTGTVSFEGAGYRVEGAEGEITLGAYEEKEINCTVYNVGGSVTFLRCVGTFEDGETTPSAVQVRP